MSVVVVRGVDLVIEPGVVSEAVREYDAWPAVHEKLPDSEILVIASPTWLGRPSSVAQRCWSGWTRCCRGVARAPAERPVGAPPG